ncbi:hypothetical protein ACOI9X_12255 [Pseudomonas sp. P2757]|uniref:hypothetical protein n=1 Tax=unclassified Pseudomonas TaxID=196821 RepID=UPI003B5B1E33
MLAHQTDPHITIDLSASEQNSQIEPNNLIQSEAFTKLTNQIKERLINRKSSESYSPALGNSQVFLLMELVAQENLHF